MPTPQEAAVDVLWLSQKAAAGVAVTYSRGATNVSLTAVPGRTITEQDNGDGTVRTMRVVDFVVLKTDLGLTPALADKITWGTRKFAVHMPAGVRHFETIGPYQTMYRIHTKEINAS